VEDKNRGETQFVEEVVEFHIQVTELELTEAERRWAEEVQRDSAERMRQQERLAAIGQLAGGIAHDFGNILTTIMLTAQSVLSHQQLPSDAAQGLETILVESRRAADLARRILDFSRHSPLETRPMALVALVEETAEILRRTLPENIHLQTEIGSDEYVVDGNSSWMRQVIMNLALNARDAMPIGGELRIELDSVEVLADEEPPLAEMTPGRWVYLVVSDTGSGIPPKVLARIFEPFFTTKSLGKGDGLGLTQAQAIVKQHGGHIVVKTAVDYGTTFRVYLPAYNGEEIAEWADPPTALALAGGGGETILVAEDAAPVRELAQEILEPLGYRILTAGDGEQALKVFRSAERVDLLIVDLRMPRMGGRELIRQLRKVAPHLKVLAITGYALPSDLEVGGDEGILDVINKPFGAHTLAQAVRRALEMS
jgi:two-component system cell cycle sensor histidine kinase/response regulator CckA